MSIPQSGGGVIERPEQLAEFLRRAWKPCADWRIGTEHEKFGYLTDTLEPLPYAGDARFRRCFERLADSFGWTRVREGDNVIGLQRDGANISLEPGGQFELVGRGFLTCTRPRRSWTTILPNCAR